jgi:hypothetical protein
MNDTFRYLLAGILIFLIIILQPFYLEWLGYDPAGKSRPNEPAVEEPSLTETGQNNLSAPQENLGAYGGDFSKKSYITISTPLYTATLTNGAGGSFVSYIINDDNSGELKYVGGYNDSGYFDSTQPVSLILPSTLDCMPCLASYNERIGEYVHFNQPFVLLNSTGSDTLILDLDEQLDLTYQMVDSEGVVMITKSVVFYGNSYISNHDFSINNERLDLFGNMEIVWDGGLRPTEERVEEDVEYGSGIISQAGEIEDFQHPQPEYPQFLLPG